MLSGLRVTLRVVVARSPGVQKRVRPRHRLNGGTHTKLLTALFTAKQSRSVLIVRVDNSAAVFFQEFSQFVSSFAETL